MSPSSPGRVVVVGGGLAGIVAALDCARSGARVTLVEVRRRLGGAAYSFEREGLRIDNGQHVFLRCCAAYRALLAQLGSEQLVGVQRRLEIPILSPGMAPTTLRRSSLPAPFHLARALLGYRHLGFSQRLAAARAATLIARLDPRDEELDRQTFGSWLAHHGQSSQAVECLWDLIALPTLNLPTDQASLALATFVFQTGLLSSANAGDIGFHLKTLSETIGEPAARALHEAGVEVRLGWRAQRLEQTERGVEVIEGFADRGDGDRAAGGLSAEAAIVAVPPSRAAGMLERLAPEYARRANALSSSPIVNLHVVYDRPVCELPFAAGVNTPVQYLFDRSSAAGAPHGCQYLAVSLSGAVPEMRMSVEALRERYLPALRELLPRAREAKVEHFMVTREHAGTFRAAPGVGAWRPEARTNLAGVVLAGAWTDTGWPATLEGAVLSGHIAAAETMRALSSELGASARALAP